MTTTNDCLHSAAIPYAGMKRVSATPEMVDFACPRCGEAYSAARCSVVAFKTGK